MENWVWHDYGSWRACTTVGGVCPCYVKSTWCNAHVCFNHASGTYALGAADSLPSSARDVRLHDAVSLAIRRSTCGTLQLHWGLLPSVPHLTDALQFPEAKSKDAERTVAAMLRPLLATSLGSTLHAVDGVRSSSGTDCLGWSQALYGWEAAERFLLN